MFFTFHQRQQEDGEEGAKGTAGKKDREAQAVKKIPHSEAQDQKGCSINRKEQADCDRQIPGLCVPHNKRLGGAVGDGKQHDDQGDGEDFRFHNLQLFSGGFPGVLVCIFAGTGGGGAQDGLAPVGYELDQDKRQACKNSGYNKGDAVAKRLVEHHADGGGHSHGQCVHHAVYAHAGADLLRRKQEGHPGGHGAGAEGKADAVYDPEEQHHQRIDGQKIACAGDGHKQKPCHGQAVFADPVNETSHNRAAEKRAQVHHAAHDAHKGRAGTESLGEPCDKRSHEHGACEIEKAGCQKKQDIF